MFTNYSDVFWVGTIMIGNMGTVQEFSLIFKTIHLIHPDFPTNFTKFWTWTKLQCTRKRKIDWHRNKIRSRKDSIEFVKFLNREHGIHVLIWSINNKLNIFWTYNEMYHNLIRFGEIIFEDNFNSTYTL